MGVRHVLGTDTIVQDIERILNSFWWGGGNNNGGIQWMAWEILACSKKEGGLGFLDFKAFNMAMVAKQGWSLLLKPNVLVSRVFKASIGDGSNIRVMQEPWLCGGGGEGSMSGPQHQGVYDITVKNLMMPNVKQWDTNVIRNLFDDADTTKILHVPLLEEVKQDRMIWKEHDGIYSVRTGYKVWRNSFRRQDEVVGDEEWCILWNIRTPPRVKHQLWIICRDCLPTRARLRHHFIMCMLACQLCDNHTEDGWNLFMGCNHNEKEEATKLGLCVVHRWNDWFQSQEDTENNARSHYVLDWRPPSVGRLKCNMDATFNNNNDTTNRGWYVRDHLDHFIYAGVAWDPGILPIIETGALALKESILEAI
ncbi:unnamed protein product [Vicia faba]|uniref:Reverse transcriptase zinc-binding domain-containing protein n=1 Tax=Vicia faba TaxID=3906 RepID=A0AAV0YNY7_VICFA|nr:unnamed protein product [Vicia faba]